MKVSLWMFPLIALLLTVSPVSFADEEEPIQTLLVTGDDVFPAHDWKESSAAFRQCLESYGGFEVRVSEDPMILDSAKALEKYDLIVLNMYNRTLPTLSDQAKENLLNFVKGGKGFVTTHLSSASFKEWEAFGDLVGRKWVMGTSGHGPRSVFTAEIADKDHPITQGIEDFEIDDELYAKLQGNAPIHVLVTADSDWSEKTEPLMFIRDYGEGRVFHDAFGHDSKAILELNHQILFARGCEWAATGKVTPKEVK